MSDKDKKHHHHILSESTSMNIFLLLLVFTVITVAVAQLDFGSLNFLIAMIIATVKAMAVMLYFMGLKYDSADNRLIFFSGYAFLGVFLGIVAIDYFARPSDMRVEDRPVFMETGGDGPNFVEPWKPSEEILAHGKELYQKQACQTCHGDEGLGNGPAGIALKARNFHIEDGWLNGPSLTGIVTTLREGVGVGMAAYPTLSTADHLALAHYVRSFAEFEVPEASTEKLATIGVDTSKEDGGLGGGEEQETIPVDFALERYLAN